MLVIGQAFLHTALTVNSDKVTLISTGIKNTVWSFGQTFLEVCMNTLIIGNFIAFIGCILMVAVGFIKEKKKILIVQCFQFGIQGIANLILGAYAGFISGMISIVRNLVFSKINSTLSLKLLFIAAQLILTMNPNSFNLIECLPVIATVGLTWFIDTESNITFKKVIIFTCTCWLIYDFSYSNYVAMSFDFFTIISNFMGIKMIQKDKGAA